MATVDPDAYEKRLKELATRLEYTFAAYAVWDSIREAYPGQSDTLSSSSPHFWSFALVVSLEYARVSTIAAFDRDKRSAGIPSLINMAKQSKDMLAPYLISQHFEEIDEVFKNCEPVVSKIRKHRNLVAHLGVVTDAERYEITERKELLKKMERIYQILFSGFKGFNPIAGEEDKYLFLLGRQVKVDVDRILGAANQV